MKEKYLSINKSGYSIRCKLYFNDLKNVRQMVVALHGFGGHKDNRATMHFAEKALSKYGSCAVLCYDQPCHGEDALKRISLEVCDRYLETVLQDLTERFPEAELYACATSFGAYLLLKYVMDHGNPFRRAVLRCPSLTLDRLLTEKVVAPQDLDKLMSGKEVLAGFDRKVRITRAFLDEIRDYGLRARDFLELSENILILQGTKDEIVSCGDVAQFADDNLIEFQAVENADHRFTDPQIMSRAIADSLKFLFSAE